MSLTREQSLIYYAYEVLAYDGHADTDEYFTVENMVHMFADDAITDQGVLDEIKFAINADRV